MAMIPPGRLTFQVHEAWLGPAGRWISEKPHWATSIQIGSTLVMPGVDIGTHSYRILMLTFDGVVFMLARS